MSRRRITRRSDAGVTLVETLIALVIMSTAIAGLVAAFASAIRGGTSGREVAKAETVLRTYAETFVHGPVGAETYGYRPCSGGAVPTYQSLTVDGFTAQVTSVEYWVAGSNPATFGGCANDASGVQKVVARVTAPSGKISDVALFVRKVA